MMSGEMMGDDQMDQMLMRDDEMDTSTMMDMMVMLQYGNSDPGFHHKLQVYTSSYTSSISQFNLLLFHHV